MDRAAHHTILMGGWSAAAVDEATLWKGVEG